MNPEEARREEVRRLGEQALEFIDGMTSDDFRADARTRLATSMIIVHISHQLGERGDGIASRRLTAQFNRARHDLAHKYDRASIDEVWETLQSIPQLLDGLDRHGVSAAKDSPRPSGHGSKQKPDLGR